MKRFLWIFLCGLLFLVVLSCYIFYGLYLRNTFNKTRERLMLIAANAALSISADEVFNIPLEQRSEGKPEYMIVYGKLTKIKEANPSFVKYVYIMTTTNEPGILRYVVDADPTPQIITANCPTSLPGDKYDARKLPELLNAYGGTSADKKITTDVWGSFISGYAPIRDASGQPIAIIGVDSDAAFIKIMQNKAKVLGQAAIFTGLLFVLSFLSLLFRK